MLENGNIESDIKKSLNIFYESGQNARHFMLFSMCSTCEISIEDE